MTIHQDVEIRLSCLSPGRSMVRALESGRHACLQVLPGDLEANGCSRSAGEGAALSQENVLTIRGLADSELVRFDLA